MCMRACVFRWVWAGVGVGVGCVHPNSKPRLLARHTAHLSTLPNEAMKDVVDEKADHLLVPACMEDGNQAKPTTFQAEGSLRCCVIVKVVQDAQAISSSTSRSSPHNAVGINL